MCIRDRYSKMNKIISKEHFSEKVFKLVIEAPLIAKSRKAGPVSYTHLLPGQHT